MWPTPWRRGAGLCREDVVRGIVSDAPERIKELVDLGIHFSEKGGPAGGFDLGMEGGHSQRRVLHVKDMTGAAIEKGLLNAIEAHPNIEVFENYFVIDLITSEKLKQPGPNRVLGIYALDIPDKKVISMEAPVTVLATGGCGKCYLYTTNPSIATGDGVAMAYRAGAPVANMEFIQFHPTALYHPKGSSFLISEALRGEGAILVNRDGKEFANKYSDQGSLAPRDIVARAIDAEMKQTGAECVYLDITHKDRDYLASRFPNIYDTCMKLGIDMAVQPIPVVPAAHYQCGGVVVDRKGATSIEGLFAIGEVACTGLHGANRLASNSLLEAVVMADRSSAAAVELLAKRKPPWNFPSGRRAGPTILMNWWW